MKTLRRIAAAIRAYKAEWDAIARAAKADLDRH